MTARFREKTTFAENIAFSYLKKKQTLNRCIQCVVLHEVIDVIMSVTYSLSF